MNAYTLVFATFMLPAATLGDRLGRRRVMLAGITVFTLASIAAALSTSSEALIVARAVQGLGAAAIMPLSLTLLAAAVPAAMRAAAIGIWGGVTGLGVALGPVIGGAVVEGVSWQAIFWLNVPVALVAVPLLLVAVPESQRRLAEARPAAPCCSAARCSSASGASSTATTTAGPPRWSSARWWARCCWCRRTSSTRAGRAHAVLPLRLFRPRSSRSPT